MKTSTIRDSLVLDHLKLPAEIARSISRRLPPSFDVDDLTATGVVALIGAAERFRPEEHGGAPFSAYARTVVRGAILESVRRRNWTANTCDALENTSEPAIQAYSASSIDRRRQLARIAEASTWLDPRKRAILAAHYGPNETPIAVIADELGISTPRVYQLHAAAVAEIRERLRRTPAARRLAAMASKPKIVILQPPTKTMKELQAQVLAELRAEVDELGALEKEFLPLRPKLARIELLRKSIRARYDDAPADKTAEAHGDRFMVMVGARANESVVNHVRLMKAIGPKLFATIARVTLKALEEHCSCTVRAQVVTVEPVGCRSLKTYERGTPELPKAA